MALIDVQDVSKLYGKVRALSHISLTIEQGEFVSIVGPSGAGKSTLLRLIIAEEPPTTGKIFAAGRDIHRLNPWQVAHYRRKIGVVFQDYKLLPQKTVYENVAYALEVSGAAEKEITQRVPRVLELVGLAERSNNLPHELSGGEQQRTSLARALVGNPWILIADEPTGNLDPPTSWDIINLMRRVNDAGTTVLLATHNRDIVNALRRRVVALREGRLISDKPRGRYAI